MASEQVGGYESCCPQVIVTDLDARTPDTFPLAPRDRPALRPTRGAEAGVAAGPMPVAGSILWGPSAGGVARLAAPPLFLTQQALQRLHDGLSATPPGRGMGLLVGRTAVCAESDAPYLLIDAVVSLPALAAERESGEALADGVARAEVAGLDVVGWYRGHSAHEATLTADDVDAHMEVFGDMSRVVVVVAGGGAAGAVFRNSPSPAWPLELQRFYEVVDSGAGRAKGRRTSVLPWRNYLAAEPVVRPRGVATTGAVAPKVYSVNAEDEGVSRLATWLRPVVRPAAYTLGAIATGLALLGLYRWLDAAPERPGGGPPVALSAVSVLDRQADTLALALEAFDIRARLFGARQMTCGDLARGIARVDQQWVAYSAARRGTALDSARDARDRALYANVRAVESRFDRTTCPRP